MALNLRKSLPADHSLVVNDVNLAVVEKFLEEATKFGPVVSVATAKEVTDQSVFIPGQPLNERFASDIPCRPVYLQWFLKVRSTQPIVDSKTNQASLGSHVKAVFLTPSKGILASDLTAGKLFIDW